MFCFCSDMPVTRIAKVERLTGPGGRTLGYFIRPGSRSRPWIWLRLGQTPVFDGDHAWFECRRVKGGWVAVRQVEDPG